MIDHDSDGDEETVVRRLRLHGALLPPRTGARPPLRSDAQPGAARSASYSLSPAATRVDQVLAAFVAPANRRAVLGSSAERAGVDLASADEAELERLVVELPRGLRLFLTDPQEFEACLRKLRAAVERAGGDDTTVLPIQEEDDLLRARGKARSAAARVGFSTVDLTRLVNTAYQLASNMLSHAGGGELEIRCLLGGRRGVEIIARDRGPGIQHLESLLTGGEGTPGAGLRAARAGVDEFDVKSAARRGTTVRAVKWAG